MYQTRKSNRVSSFSWLKQVSIEPSLFLFRFTYCVAEIVQKNLYLQKACRVNCTSEPDLTTPCDDTETGVRFVAFVGANISSVGIFAVTFLCIIYASYSDKIGKRKPFILLPCIGLLVNSVLGCVHSYWWSLPPIYAALTEAICHVVFGSFHTFIMFSHIYISNVTTPESRTARMGYLMVLKLLAVTSGSGAAGYLVNWFGFLGSYILCSVLSLLTLCMAVALIREAPVLSEQNESKKFAPIRGILTSYKTIFGRRSGKQKIVVALLLLNLNLLLFAHEGESQVKYIYLRYRFKWDEKMYSLLTMCDTLALTIGVLLSSLIFSKMLRLNDCVIGIIAGCWDTMIALALLFCVNNWQLYTASAFDLFFGVALNVCSSYLSKFYKSNEQGQLNAIGAICSLILIPLCHVVYNGLFQKTLHVFPQAFFIINIVIYVTTTINSSIAYALTKDGIEK